MGHGMGVVYMGTGRNSNGTWHVLISVMYNATTTRYPVSGEMFFPTRDVGQKEDQKLRVTFNNYYLHHILEQDDN